jgi:hypothetical protein
MPLLQPAKQVGYPMRQVTVERYHRDVAGNCENSR